MKTMNVLKMKKLHCCLTFRQVVCVALTCLSFSLTAADTTKKLISRKPAAVEEEVLTIPLENTGIFTNEKIFAEDDAGVMRDMSATFGAWEKTENYARVWGLESTGLYKTPSIEQKQKYLSVKILRYADKRLSGEMKNAPEGSTLNAVRNVEKNLRPNAAVNVSKNFGFKFKARVLQGKAIVEVKNPWVECNATVNVKGKTRVITRKEFKELGLSSGAEYSVNDSKLLTYVDQQLTDNVKARLSNTTGVGTDSRLEMTASFPFNL
jgi:hypothetical protein